MLHQMLFDYQKQKELEEARRKDKRKKAKETLKKYSTGKNKGLAKNTINDAKDLVKNATPWRAVKLLSKANPITDWMYGLAFVAALFKDVLDFVEITGILYIIVFMSTFLVSIFIAMMMLLGSFTTGHGRGDQKIIRSWLILIGGTTAELLFGINFLPIETITVALIYMFALSSRIQDQEQEKSASPNKESYA